MHREGVTGEPGEDRQKVEVGGGGGLPATSGRRRVCRQVCHGPTRLFDGSSGRTLRNNELCPKVSDWKQLGLVFGRLGHHFVRHKLATSEGCGNPVENVQSGSQHVSKDANSSQS